MLQHTQIEPGAIVRHASDAARDAQRAEFERRMSVVLEGRDG